MNNLAVFMILSLSATPFLSSCALDDLDGSITAEESISDNNVIVPEENNSRGALDESHLLQSFNYSVWTAKPTKKPRKPPSLDFTLTGSRAVSPGSQITYTIKYKNNMKRDVDLVITEDYGPGTVFMKSDPEPDSGTDNKWTIKGLPPSNKWKKIKVTVRVPKLTCEAEIESSVSGIGYSSVHKVLSTDKPSYRITNLVTLSYENIKKSLSITTAIKPVEGANIDFSEHGSGEYKTDEAINFSSSRLSVNQNLRTKGTLASVNVSNHPLIYNGSWYANHICENRITKAAFRENYLQVNALSSISNAEIHKKWTWMETESNFTGIAEYSSKGKNAAVDEMFIGSFQTKNKQIESYNSSTKHPLKGWLESCTEEPDDQLVNENETQTEIDAGNETIEEGGFSDQT